MQQITQTVAIKILTVANKYYLEAHTTSRHSEISISVLPCLGCASSVASFWGRHTPCQGNRMVLRSSRLKRDCLSPAKISGFPLIGSCAHISTNPVARLGHRVCVSPIQGMKTDIDGGRVPQGNWGAVSRRRHVFTIWLFLPLLC